MKLKGINKGPLNHTKSLVRRIPDPLEWTSATPDQKLIYSTGRY